MMNVIAYGSVGLSLLVMLIKAGQWVLEADPRLIRAGLRWSGMGAATLLPLALATLVIGGRWQLALMLAAVIVPALVHGALRWRPVPARFDWAAQAEAGVPAARPGAMDPDLIREAAAVLRAYTATALEAPVRQIAQERPARMSAAEASRILSLPPDATPAEIEDAHQRLAAMLSAEPDRARYLLAQIDEARDVLRETTPA